MIGHDWRSRGACRSKPTRWFYPDATGQLMDIAVADALATCALCPVLLDCRTWALAHEDNGVWGGLTEEERRHLRRRQGIRLTAPETVVRDDTWKRDHAVALWQQGWKISEITAELGTYTEKINRWLNAAGIDAVPPPDGSRARRQREERVTA